MGIHMSRQFRSLQVTQLSGLGSLKPQPGAGELPEPRLSALHRGHLDTVPTAAQSLPTCLPWGSVSAKVCCGSRPALPLKCPSMPPTVCISAPCCPLGHAGEEGAVCNSQMLGSQDGTGTAASWHFLLLAAQQSLCCPVAPVPAETSRPRCIPEDLPARISCNCSASSSAGDSVEAGWTWTS